MLNTRESADSRPPWTDVISIALPLALGALWVCVPVVLLMVGLAVARLDEHVQWIHQRGELHRLIPQISRTLPFALPKLDPFVALALSIGAAALGAGLLRLSHAARLAAVPAHAILAVVLLWESQSQEGSSLIGLAVLSAAAAAALLSSSVRRWFEPKRAAAENFARWPYAGTVSGFGIVVSLLVLTIPGLQLLWSVLPEALAELNMTTHQVNFRDVPLAVELACAASSASTALPASLVVLILALAPSPLLRVPSSRRKGVMTCVLLLAPLVVCALVYWPFAETRAAVFGSR